MKSLIAGVLIVLSAQPAFASSNDQVVELQVTENGFEPSRVDVKPGSPVVLKITRKTDSTCATKIKIKSKNVSKDLPLNKTVTVALGKLDKGEIRFACGMDMISGLILVH